MSDLIGMESPQQKAVNEIVDTTKAIVLEALEEAKNELMARELTDEQKEFWNEFSSSFALKVTQISLKVE